MAFSSPRKRPATALDKLHLQTKRECWGDDSNAASLVDGKVRDSGDDKKKKKRIRRGGGGKMRGGGGGGKTNRSGGKTRGRRRRKVGRGGGRDGGRVVEEESRVTTPSPTNDPSTQVFSRRLLEKMVAQQNDVETIEILQRTLLGGDFVVEEEMEGEDALDLLEVRVAEEAVEEEVEEDVSEDVDSNALIPKRTVETPPRTTAAARSSPLSDALSSGESTLSPAHEEEEEDAAAFCDPSLWSKCSFSREVTEQSSESGLKVLPKVLASGGRGRRRRGVDEERRRMLKQVGAFTVEPGDVRRRRARSEMFFLFSLLLFLLPFFFSF